jgi:glycine reductase
MDAKNQENIKMIAEGDKQEKKPSDNIIVVLGASDLEGAEISAETVTLGDPSFTGPLAGVSLGLPVYHILEPELKGMIPDDVYEESLGIWSMAVDTELIGKRFKEIREKASKNIPGQS